MRIQIRSTTGWKESPDYTFHGQENDKPPFSRLVEGVLHQWQIWDSDTHIALLDPNGTTPGCTIVMPKFLISPNVSLLSDVDFESLLVATYNVMEKLKRSLQVRWCGMIFEEFSSANAQMKLIPIHEAPLEKSTDVLVQTPASFTKDPQGYLTNQYGLRHADPAELSDLTASVRRTYDLKQKINVPYSWKNPSDHALVALQSPWYTTMFRMQSSMYHDAIELFQRIQKYEYLVVPVTTSSISSPMGLGSDSEPMDIQLWGKHDYLADSQQFALEWGLRLQDGLKGVYYCGTSCRGEDADAAHLNQFCHFECELHGELDDGIEVAERYIIHTTRSLLRKYSTEIIAVAGTTKHIEDVIQLWTSLGGKFPRVSLDEALSFPETTSEMWRDVVPERPELGKALTRKGELMLIEKYGGAVWLTEMHHQSVPFYQAYLNGDTTKASCADFLIGLGEIMGCGARHETADQVLDSLARHELDVGQYSWYVDMRRLKPMKTVGWGMGIERYLCWIMQHMDVRDIQVILRLKGSAYSP